MIDVIVVGEDDFEKTLFSISIQTIKDKIRVIIVSNKKHSFLSHFKDVFPIQEIVTKENTIGKKRQIGFLKATGDYVFFMNAGDVLFDAFSLFNCCKSTLGNDVVIGGIHNASKKYSNYYLVGNLYRRKTLKLYSIPFHESDGLENGFHQLLFMSPAKIVYTGDIIYFQKYEIDKDYHFYHSLLEDSYFALGKAKTRSYDSSKIAKLIYDVLLFFANSFRNQKEEYQDMLIQELKPLMKQYYHYQKYLQEDDKKFISDINVSNYIADQICFEQFEKEIIL